MTIEQRVRELHDRAVRGLVESHTKPESMAEYPLVLAIRYRLNDLENIHLFEVLRGFPGEPDDELFGTEYEPSAQLRIIGKLHLLLASPEQLRTAITRGDSELEAIRRGEILHDDGSREAAALRKELGL